MKLVVFTGKTCPKCPAAKELCEEVAKERGYEYEEKDIEDNMFEALQLQIASTPTIVLDEEVLFRSDPPTKEELLDAIEEFINSKK
ncbi:thioredoxin family protein [Candidatus Woesearchaeota archaeon]|nr:thioredoxin family protein [Candidatus Woesearchaeota archaeon]MBW3021696.1 thioredoxin family protein [Candidatus Woesearchaeota archaeon]